MRLERLTTVRTLEVVLPHPVNHSKSNKSESEHQASEECGIRVQNEDEVMYIDHELWFPPK